ncbi:hypothetical protein JCM1840_007486 [Sporobolomyces johnsonii]
MTSSLFSARGLSLVAVCLQSTALAIVLHVSQAHLRPGQVQYKASSAVLLTEFGKLFLSLLLALRDTLKERATLLAPRHPLPSAALYARCQETQSKDHYNDPYHTLSPATQAAPLPSRSNHLRRRSSQNARLSFSVTLDVSPSSVPNSTRFSEASSLASFQWPHKPFSLSEKLGKLKPESAEPVSDPAVMKMLADPKMWVRRRRLGAFRMLWEDIFGGDWWMMAGPAVLFAVQNNLIYVAARNLSVPVFQITFQLKTLITAVCAVAMLGRRLSPVQWFSLVTLGFGVATMQLGAIYARASDSHGHGLYPEIESSNHVAGVTAILVSCFSSAIAATYFELVIKRRAVVPPVEEYMLVAPPTLKPTSLWVRNIQLSLFSSVFGLGVVVFQANDFHFSGMAGLSLDFKGMVDPLEHWYDPLVHAGHGFFEGFHPLAWFVIFLQTVGGLLIAVAIKHADNVAKGFAMSISIVFTFLLSVILFDFQLSLSSIIGGAVVVGSTILFEMGPRDIRQLLSPTVDAYRKPLLRRWHYILFVVLLTTFGAAVFPTKHYSVTTAVWELVNNRLLDKKHGLLHSHDGLALGSRPTVAVADMGPINALLTRAAGPGVCGWGVRPQRETTRSPFGPSVTVGSDYPYWVTNTNQHALDDILTTRFQAYSNLVPLLSTPSPDFIFLPVLSQIWSNPWGCSAPELLDGIRQTSQYLRDIVASVGETRYPRIILPIAPVRSQLERDILTPELMDEIKDSVIVVSIENAPKTHQERMKYLIDVPYPTGFHLSTSAAGAKPSIGDHILHADRPYLLHYAAATSHPRGLPSSDPFNGYALRSTLHKELGAYVTSSPANAASRILFDDHAHSLDGAQNLTLLYEHMSSAVFCLVPPGDSPTSRAFYESLLLGCIPVLFREHSYGRLFPSSPEINNMRRYTVLVEENDLINGVGPSPVDRLEAISPAEVRKMQRHIREIAPKLQWSLPDEDLWFEPSLTTQLASPLPEGVPTFNRTEAVEQAKAHPPTVDAFEMLLRELQTIKDGEWVAGRARDVRRGMQPFGSARRL